MKNLPLVVCLLLLLAACQKSADQRQQPDEPQIFGLGPTCDFCVNALIDSSCCCIVEVIAPTTSASIQLCGTTSPVASTCPGFTPPPGCPTPGPGLEAMTINTTTPYEFCAAENTVFQVINTGTSTVRIKITCFTGAISDPFVTLSLDPYGSGTLTEVAYIGVSDGCAARACSW